MISLFQKFQHGLQKTKTSLVRRIRGIFTNLQQWDDEAFDELEAGLIGTDLGVDLSFNLVAEIRDRYERGELTGTDDILAVARARVLEVLGTAPPRMNMAEEGPTVILLVGVNGSGKTTTAAKLAHLWLEDGKSVLLGAADTFRAAGTEQLRIWAERVGCPVVAGKQGGDAAAVAFDAVTSARQRKIDVVLIDTAGRQHTRRSLMVELEKLQRTIGKACPGAPHEVWLTVDASTGTNALVQAREFGNLFPITGLILTKLDGSGKGGVVVAIRQELGHPVHFVGLGEEMSDLQPFDAEMFARALFE